MGVIQNLALVNVATVVGTALAPTLGLSAPLFEAIVGGDNIWMVLSALLPLTAALSAIVVVPFLLTYYLYIRPRLGSTTVCTVEGSEFNSDLQVDYCTEGE